MGIYVYSCVLCGMAFNDAQPQKWLKEFRAGLKPNPTMLMNALDMLTSDADIVYTEGRQWSSPRLSGVGTVTEFEYFSAPLDSDLRYDDAGLHPSSLSDFWLFKCFFERENMAVPTVDVEKPWGFPFHESCWVLLGILYHPNKLEIRALNNLFRSFPIQCRQLELGHDYGGLKRLVPKPEDLLPGEENRLSGANTKYDKYYSGPTEYCDPLDIRGLEGVFKQGFYDEKGITEEIVTNDILCNLFTSESADCFNLLPVEIMQDILILLPSKDMLSIKLASKKFAVTPLPGLFWASRFQRGFEFHCIFEAQGIQAKDRDWKAAYFGVRSLRDNACFKNRLRIWGLLLHLDELLFRVTSTELGGSVSRSFFELDAPDDKRSWDVVSGVLKEPGRSFDYGCRTLFTRTIDVATEISNVFLTFTRFNSKGYISGLRFQQVNNVDVCLGYNNPNKEIPMDIDGSLLRKGERKISRFYLAIDSRGVRAISLVTSKDQMLKWFGEQEGIPKTRLILNHKITLSFKGEFDAFKLVALGTLGDDSTTGSLDLRHHRWLPEVPNEALSLNERDFPEITRQSPRKYQPLIMMVYGGLHGSHLLKLVGITVWIVDFDRIYGIDFTYSVEVDHRKVHTLGRQGPILDINDEDYEPFDSSERYEFSIAGAQGEIINGVDIQTTDYGDLTGLRIHTNFGRTALFPPVLEYDAPLLPVQTTKSSTIIGFYATLVRNHS